MIVNLISSLQLGVNNVVILNDFEAVKNAFSQDQILGRPSNSFGVALRATNLTDDNGPIWREHRLFAMQVLKNLGFGKESMEERIIEEIGYLVVSIDNKQGDPINIRTILAPCIFNIISQLMFGHRLETDDPKVVRFFNCLEVFISDIVSPISLLVNCPVWLITLIVRIGLGAKRKLIDQTFNIFE